MLRGHVRGPVAHLLPGAVVLALAVGAPARAQTPAQRPLMLVPVGGTVRVILPESPAWGAVVFRRPLPDSASRVSAARWTQLTPTPLRRIDDPAEAERVLGADRAEVMQAMGAADPVQLVRRLIYDRFNGAVQALLHPTVAIVRGQLFVDTTALAGAHYAYRAAFLAANGRDTAQVATGTVHVVDVPPAAPGTVTATVAGQDIVVAWHYPAFTGAPGDNVVAFTVYRTAAPDTTPHRLTRILRVSGVPAQWRDRSVRPGVRYTYTMRALDAAGREGPASTPTSVTMIDTRPLAPPADLVAKGTTGIVHLVWRMSPESRVQGYRVERAGSLFGKYTTVTPGLVPAQSPEWTDSAVTGNAHYFYKVVAVDSAGRASDPSVAIPVVAEDHTPPTPPAHVVVKVEAGRATVVTWQASPSTDVKGYYVYRGDDTTKLVRLTTTPLSATQYRDSGFANHGLQPGHRYAIRVTAVDRAYNESAPADTSVFVPDNEAPGAPTALRAANHDGRWVDVSWGPSPAVDVRSYVLARADVTVGDTMRVIATVPRVAGQAMTARRDTTAAHGHRYVYRVTAIDSAGNVSPAVVDSVLFRGVVPPPPTRFVGARYVAGGVEVRWERVIAPELAGYVVYRGSSPTGRFTRVAQVPAGSLTWRDPKPVPGAFYTVRAIDRSGNESRRALGVPAVHPGAGR